MSGLAFLYNNIGAIILLSLIIIIFIVIYERNHKSYEVPEKIKKENWVSSMDLKASRVSVIIVIFFVILGMVFSFFQK